MSHPSSISSISAAAAVPRTAGMQRPDARRLRLPAALALAHLAACGDDARVITPGGSGQGFQIPEGPVYTTVAQVETPSGATTLLSFTGDVPDGELDTGRALELPGFADATTHEGHLYVSDSEALTLTRYEVDGTALVERGVLGLQSRGMTFIGDPFFVSPERAFLVNPDQLEIVEWNPSTMTVTNSHDISALGREGWGHEYRAGYLREADGVLFIVWAYTNNRVEFLNDFIVGVFDTTTGSFEVIVDEQCPASAAFGGFFDERGDLYLPADSFGGFTFFDGAEPKEPCIRRIRPGERGIDPSYDVRPMQALGGLSPWGLYYAGSGVAYTTAVDPARSRDYPSVYEFIFDTIHEGYALDLASGESRKIEGMPPDAVGFESVTIEGQVLIPRSAGAVRIYDIDTVQTRVYTLDPATKVATPRFTLPGYLAGLHRLR